MKGVNTSKQLADLQEKCNALLSRIQNCAKSSSSTPPMLCLLFLKHYVRKPTHLQHQFHHLPKASPKIYLYSYPLRYHHTFVLYWNSKKLVSWNDVSVSLKQTTLSPKSNTSKGLSRVIGFLNVWTCLEWEISQLHVWLLSTNVSITRPVELWKSTDQLGVL